MKLSAVIITLALVYESSHALAPPSSSSSTTSLPTQTSRRATLGWLVSAATAAVIGGPSIARADVDTDDFIRTGMVSMPMGVSGQAGKSKPTTGVIFRDGTEVSRDQKSGDVLAEILVKDAKTGDMMPVVTTFASPWPLATGSVFDIECRDADTGDAAFVAVTPSVDQASLADLKDSFFTKTLFSPTGRFSFYGQPTDVKVKTASVNDKYRVLDVSFSTLSQSTQTEIPRKARVVATIPEGSSQAVMLIASASALRWKKGADKKVIALSESFKATPAPQTGLKVRAKESKSSNL